MVGAVVLLLATGLFLMYIRVLRRRREFYQCEDLVDADMPDLQACFDAVGRSGLTDM